MPPALNHCWIASAGEPATLCRVSSSTIPSLSSHQHGKVIEAVRIFHTSVVGHDEPVEPPILKCFIEQRVHMGWDIVELVIGPAWTN